MWTSEGQFINSVKYYFSHKINRPMEKSLIFGCFFLIQKIYFNVRNVKTFLFYTIWSEENQRNAPCFFHSFNFPLWPHKGETLGNKSWPAIGKASWKSGPFSRHMGFAFINLPNWFLWWTSQYGRILWCVWGAISFINMSIIDEDNCKCASCLSGLAASLSTVCPLSEWPLIWAHF